MQTRQRPRYLALTLVLATLAVLGILAPERSAQAGDDEIVLKFASVAPEGTPWTEQLTAIKKRVEADTDIKFKLYPGSMLGGEVETLRKGRRNQIQGWGGSTAAIAEALGLDALQVFELPFMFESEAEVDFVMDAMFDTMAAKLREKGFVLSFWHVNGWHNFAFDRSVRSPADLAGLKMRSQESPVHLWAFKALGAQPQTLPVPEVLSALQTGMVDGFSNTPLFTAATGWYEGGVTHYTLTQHIYQPAAIIYNAEFWDSLTPEQQASINGDRAVETKTGRDTVRAMTPELLDMFRDNEIEVLTPTAAERAAFAELVKDVPDELTERIGQDVIDAVLLARDTYRRTH
jgi:TRAP-type transport system periplasmic protein